MTNPAHVLVVGAGVAGAAAAAAVVRHAPQVRLTVVGDEPCLPYNRTAVNKGLLLGQMNRESMTLPDAASLERSTYLVDRAEGLDLAARSVRLTSGTSIAFDRLVVATGARAVPSRVEVDPEAMERVLHLRTVDDGERLRALVHDGGHEVVVIGAGLIGNETAGVLRDLGNRVCVVSRGAHPQADRWGLTVSDWLVDEQRAAGVRVELGRCARRIARHGSGRLEVRLDDATVLPADVVVVSTGVQPDVGWLAGTPIAIADGVPVDARMRTTEAGIYAAGDLTLVTGNGPARRVEHWGSALHQGRAAGRAVLEDLGVDAPRPDGTAELPAYNSYFRDAKITVLGDPYGFTRETVIAGTPGPDRFTVALTDDQDRLLSVVGVRGARATNRLRELVEARGGLDQVAALLA